MAKQLRAILLLPFTVTVIIPASLLGLTQSFNLLWGTALPSNLALLMVALVLAGGGLWLIISTIRLFMAVGKGTLAPWDATTRLVVVGSYRYVRNPMISGVCAILIAEGLLSGSWTLAGWSLLFIVGNMIYIPLSEEPGLERRFGDDYRNYKQHVPRWLPRRTPWTPLTGDADPG